MPEPHESVVNVVGVRGVDACALGHPSDICEGHVRDRHTEDEQREEQRRVEEVRLAAHTLGSAPDLHGGGSHQQAEEERTGITHEHPRRIEVVRKKAEADSAGDHGDERPEIRGLQRTQFHQSQPVDGEGARGDGDDAGSKTVEAVDQVDRVRDADHPKGGDQGGEVRGEHHGPGERDLQPEHGGPEKHEHHCREDLACHLGRGRDLTGIVEEPYAEDDRGAENDTERLRGTLEDLAQVSDVVGDDYRDEEREEHRGTSAVRDGMVVESSLVRLCDEGNTSREAPEREGQQVTAHRGDSSDDGIVTDRRHDWPLTQTTTGTVVVVVLLRIVARGIAEDGGETRTGSPHLLTARFSAKRAALAVAGMTPLKATGSDSAPLLTSSSPVAWSLAVIPSPTQAPEISVTVRPPSMALCSPRIGDERASSDITEPTVRAAAVLW